MAEAKTEWAPIYVIGGGFKKINGAYKGSGNFDGCLRYKHPDHMIWAFYSGDKQIWMFSNKSRYLDDGKIMYKNKSNCEPGAAIPQKGWKKGSPPGSSPPPKVINSAFVAGEEVHIYSKKKKKWVEGAVKKVNESGNYKCQIKGMRKQINIPRDQLREFPEGSKFSVKQFVEIRSKAGDWLEAMIGDVKGEGKYYVVLPSGKGTSITEDRIRPSALCQDAVDDTPAAATNEDGGAGGAGDKDARIAELEQTVADLEAKLKERDERIAALEKENKELKIDDGNEQ